ncbi:MAG: carboxyl transferase domain-containing protein, partial [Bacteroidales bacterium]
MFILETKINTNSEEFKKNKEEYLRLLDKYKEIHKEIIKGGQASAIKKHKERGKLLVRERIDLLVDANTPFLELSPLAAYDQYNNEFPSAGIVTGIGLIHGREVVIIANDATVKGGTYMKWAIKKHLRAQE